MRDGLESVSDVMETNAYGRSNMGVCLLAQLEDTADVYCR